MFAVQHSKLPQDTALAIEEGYALKSVSKAQRRLRLRLRGLAVPVVLLCIFVLVLEQTSSPVRLLVSSGVDRITCKSAGYGTKANVACQFRLARQIHNDILVRQSDSVDDVLRKYVQRYHRQAPHGLRQWAQYAIDAKSPILDDYDLIDDDLAPFRIMGKELINKRIASALEGSDGNDYIRIQNGAASGKGHETFAQILAPIVHRLPDLVLPLNPMDEPRVIGTTELDSTRTSVEFSNLAFSPHLWNAVTRPCLDRYRSDPRRRRRRRVNAWLDRASDLCANPALHAQNGFLQSASYFLNTNTLYPIAGGLSKLSTFGDIRAPAKCYFEDYWRAFDQPDTVAWANKTNKLYWRGSNTGYYPDRDAYRTGHRQRFVIFANNLVNSTERGMFPKKPIDASMVDVGFTAFTMCSSAQVCQQQASALGVRPKAQVSDSFAFRYTFDMDGNGQSCRYYRLLESNSVVFKQTIQREWHDDRLIPWLHYVPISMSMNELPEVLEYFVKSAEGQQIGAEIARAGRNWAKQSLRQVDQTIYWYRLLLEYAMLFK